MDANESGTRKVVLIMGMTIDGFGAPGWTPSATWQLPVVQEAVREQLRSVDTFIFGRTTYEVWRKYWPGVAADPTSTDFEREFSRMTDEVQKVVYSRSLETATWRNSRLVSGSIVDDVARMKGVPGGDLAIVGGPRIARAFGDLGLIDEYRLWIHPTVQGTGTPLLGAPEQARSLEFVSARAFGSGALSMHLQRSGR